MTRRLPAEFRDKANTLLEQAKAIAMKKDPKHRKTLPIDGPTTSWIDPDKCSADFLGHCSMIRLWVYAAEYRNGDESKETRLWESIDEVQKLADEAAKPSNQQ